MLENQQSRAFLKSTPYNNTSASTKPNGHTVLENHCRGEDFTKNCRFLSDESQFCQKYTDENSRQNVFDTKRAPHHPEGNRSEQQAPNINGKRQNA